MRDRITFLILALSFLQWTTFELNPQFLATLSHSVPGFSPWTSAKKASSDTRFSSFLILTSSSYFLYLASKELCYSNAIIVFSTLNVIRFPSSENTSRIDLKFSYQASNSCLAFSLSSCFLLASSSSLVLILSSCFLLHSTRH